MIEKKKPQKKRLSLHLNEFWEVYRHAETYVQKAMVISLMTTMREADIATLRFDSVHDGQLCVSIGKSVSQRGSQGAAHLKWDLSEHDSLRAVINECREISLKHQRCPFIISRARKIKKERDGFPHPFQVTPSDISKGFTKAVRNSGIWKSISPERTPPTFHEVRGLSISLFLNSGIDARDVAQLAAHTDVSVTKSYTANHRPEYRNTGLVMTNQMMAIPS